MVILGAPGSGKGTQSSRLLKEFPTLKTIVVGDLLRGHIARGTALGKEADKTIKSGGLMPDEKIAEMLEPELEALKDKQHWILDGFPRRRTQARILEDMLSRQGQPLTLVVNLVVPHSAILQRIEERWVHAPSGRTYNISWNPPKVPGKDDVTGENLIKRDDDNAETVAKRLQGFHAENKPISNFIPKSMKFPMVVGRVCSQSKGRPAIRFGRY